MSESINSVSLAATQSSTMLGQGVDKADKAASAAPRPKSPEPQTIQQSEGVDALSVANVIEQLNQIAESQQTDLKFKVDEPTGKVVVAVYDKVSQELIRQIPGEEVLQLAESFSNGDNGALMNVVT